MENERVGTRRVPRLPRRRSELNLPVRVNTITVRRDDGVTEQRRLDTENRSLSVTCVKLVGEHRRGVRREDFQPAQRVVHAFRRLRVLACSTELVNYRCRKKDKQMHQEHFMQEFLVKSTRHL
jgi:hypothetical protein